MAAARTPELFVEHGGALCECPLWDDRTQHFYWVDIPAGAVHRADESGARDGSWELGTPVGAISRRACGGWIAALARGFGRYDEEWSADRPVIEVADQPANTRFNDGAADARGRFWAGTLSEDRTPRRCSLYRLEASGQVTAVLREVTTSNGLGWSPDGRTMYYIDTGAGRLDTLTFDQEDDHMIARRTLVRVAPDDGRPDGLAVDTDGCIWIALWGSGMVRRYTPTGRVDREIHVPASNVSSVAFGGRNVSTLFITTAAAEPPCGRGETEPLAGSIFAVETDAVGVPVGAFAG